LHKGFDKQFGARPLKRAIQKYVEDAISRGNYYSKISIGDQIFMDMKMGHKNLR
jgi:ATP-dependent Clp protease ATP-binding subunit ClpC